jgi:hypothetical protein
MQNEMRHISSFFTHKHKKCSPGIRSTILHLNYTVIISCYDYYHISTGDSLIPYLSLVS